MTTYKFEVAAKNALINTIRERYGEEYVIQDISAVWMTHLLGYKKGIFIDCGKNTRLYEVTYNKDKDEMYIDVYEKKVNRCIPAKDFEFDVANG